MAAGIKVRIEKLEGAAKSGSTLYAVVVLPGLASDPGIAEKINQAIQRGIPASNLKRASGVVPICFQGMTSGDEAKCGSWWWGPPQYRRDKAAHQIVQRHQKH